MIRTEAGVDWAADDYRRLFPHPKRAVAASTNFAGEGNIVVVAVSPERIEDVPPGEDGWCAEIATDPRVAPTTAPDALEAGERLDFWLEGKPVI